LHERIFKPSVRQWGNFNVVVVLAPVHVVEAEYAVNTPLLCAEAAAAKTMTSTMAATPASDWSETWG
jgi:hypothetical protein